MSSPTTSTTLLDRPCAIVILYADNLVVDDHGALVAILDWDMAEAWDPGR